MKKFFIAAIFIFICKSLWATQCYNFTDENSPESLPHKYLNELKNIQTWCYENVDKATTFIFNKNNMTELSMLVRKENGKIVSIIHTDLKRDNVRYFEQNALILNPYQIPLSTEELTYKEPVPVQFEKGLLQEKILELQTSSKTLIDAEDFKINKINKTILPEKEYLAKEDQPLNGYWWPHKNVPLARPENSPLHLYDKYVKSVTGTDPKSRAWELKYHSLEHVPWGGHCNGWAASSVLHDFQDKSLYDDKNNTYISPSDIQGMRAETSFCVKWAFYGRRYADENSDLRDIRADRFHKVLRYYIKYKKKAIAHDYMNKAPVDNHIISGYEFQVQDLGENKYQVTAYLKVHGYSLALVEKKEVAPKVYESRYTYLLETDNSGNIIKGTWTSIDNPDFLWVPLAQEKCGRENPRMHHGWIDHMIRNLEEKDPPPAPNPTPTPVTN